MMKLPAGKKTFFVYGVYTALLLALVLAALMIPRYVAMQINDNARINSVGRLRMLSQKITKNVLLYRDGAVGRDVVEGSISLFDDSIHAVAGGGSITLDMERGASATVPEMDDPASRRMLDTAIRQWETFEWHITGYLQSRNIDSLNYILAHNEALVETLDRSVLVIQKHADRDQMAMGLFAGTAIAIIMAALTVELIRQVRRYREAARQLEEMERLLPICAGCKKIRTDNNRPYDPRSWTSIDVYLRDNKDMTFTHSLCPDCMNKYDPGPPGRGSGTS